MVLTIIMIFLLSISFCDAMNGAVFNRDESEVAIERACGATQLIPVIKQQLGLARFVAERVQIDDTDSYMDMRYASSCFDYRHMVELFLKDAYAARRRPIRYVAPYSCIDCRKYWLYHLTYCLRELELAEKKSCVIGAARAIAASYLLAHFSSDIGSIELVHPENFGMLSELKQSALVTNTALFNVLLLLHKNKRSRYSWGFNPFKSRECEHGYVEEPRALSNDFYLAYYCPFVPVGECDPRGYLISHYGIYDAVSLVPAPANSLGAHS